MRSQCITTVCCLSSSTLQETVCGVRTTRRRAAWCSWSMPRIHTDWRRHGMYWGYVAVRGVHYDNQAPTPAPCTSTSAPPTLRARCAHQQVRCPLSVYAVPINKSAVHSPCVILLARVGSSGPAPSPSPHTGQQVGRPHGDDGGGGADRIGSSSPSAAHPLRCRGHKRESTCAAWGCARGGAWTHGARAHVHLLHRAATGLPAR